MTKLEVPDGMAVDVSAREITASGQVFSLLENFKVISDPKLRWIVA